MNIALHELFELVEQYYRHNQPDKIEACYFEILERAPYNPDALLGLALLNMQRENWAEALKLFRTTVTHHPDHVPTHFHLGLFFLKRQELEFAQIQFQNVVTLMPDHGKAHFYLGTLSLHKKDFENAKTHLLLSLEYSEAENLACLNNLGICYLETHQEQQACRFFMEVITRDNHHFEARNNFAHTFFLHHRYQQAKVHYEALLQDFPENTEIKIHYALTLLQTGQYSECIDIFLTLYQNNPTDFVVVSNLGIAYYKMGNYVEAERYLNGALQLRHDPNLLFILDSINQSEHYARVPDSQVQSLFAHYAPNYEYHLCQQLGYQVPQHLQKIWLAHQHHEKNNLRILDLGCGTGLVGTYFKPYAHTLMGVDLSQEMLNIAQKKNCYTKLFCCELTSFLAKPFALRDEETLSSPEEEASLYGLIVAAEVFSYFGALNQIVKGCAQHLKKKGYLLFTTELLEEEKKGQEHKPLFFQLQRTGRFAHRKSYLENVAKENNFRILSSITQPLRKENHQEVSGLYMLWLRED